jgi:hypothetical protein
MTMTGPQLTPTHSVTEDATMTDMTQKTRRVPTPEEIASAYESLGGCDECLGPADAFEDRLNSSSIPDPSGHPDLLRLTVVDFAGCSRCRTRWSVQVGVSYRRRDEMPPHWFEPVPLDTWRDVKGDGLPPFVRAIRDARHLVAQVDAPEPIKVALTPEDMETAPELDTNVTFYGPAGAVEVTLRRRRGRRLSSGTPARHRTPRDPSPTSAAKRPRLAAARARPAPALAPGVWDPLPPPPKIFCGGEGRFSARPRAFWRGSCGRSQRSRRQGPQAGTPSSHGPPSA